MKKVITISLLSLLCSIAAMAQEQDPWVGTWTSVCIVDCSSIPKQYENMTIQQCQCTYCHGKGTVTTSCHFCYGVGGRPCPTCKKKGFVPCACKGSDDDCGKCGGTGWRPCPNEWCLDGIEVCRGCKGSGKEEKNCPACHGRGIAL